VASGLWALERIAKPGRLTERPVICPEKSLACYIYNGLFPGQVTR